jgi:hypothetical protein
MNFAVEITADDGPEVQTTTDVNEALDWFTNACTEIFEEESGVNIATLVVDGVEWGRIEFGGPGGSEGERRPKLHAVAGGRS